MIVGEILWKKINIIIPIVSNNYDLSKKTKQLKAFFKKV